MPDDTRRPYIHREWVDAINAIVAAWHATPANEPTAVVDALSELAQKDLYPSIHLRRPMNGHPWRARIGYHAGWRGPECEGATPAEAISGALKAAHRAPHTREATDA